MSTKILTLFNNKGGVGKTSLLYHLAWMYAEQGKNVLVADLDPQCNLTSAFLPDGEVEKIWESSNPGSTIYKCLVPLMDVYEVVRPALVPITPKLSLIPGDVALSSFEDTLAKAWSESLSDTNLRRPLRILSAFWNIMQDAAKEIEADIILADIGPNLGAINRAALIATDFVIIPLGADLFSLQGLKNLGPAFKNWETGWGRRVENWQKSPEFSNGSPLSLPSGDTKILGYICQQHSIRRDRPVQAYEKWIARIPSLFRDSVLPLESLDAPTFANDPYCLATIKHYRSLIPIGQEVRQPIFKLSAADGAIGSHAQAAQSAYHDFSQLAKQIWNMSGLP